MESTYNWYWLVDGLMEEGYRVHLANPSAIQQYSGMKHLDDRHDAFWLAEMLRLGILPEGYIYPKEERAASPYQAANGENKHQPIVSGETGLLDSSSGVIVTSVIHQSR